MTGYQLYLFRSDERKWRVVALDCRDDAEALKVAAEHSGRRVMELWRGSRFVDRFPKKARVG